VFNKLIQIFKIRDLRNKILFVLGVFVIFRIMANIPIPGIDPGSLKDFFEKFQIFGLLNVFTGGTLDRLSIAMLGLGPYITAVIIFQLLTMIFPQLEEMYKKGGEAERQRFNQYCRIATAPLAALQAFGMLTLLQRQKVIGTLSPDLLLSSIVTITAGTMLLMWLGELISEKGIGNGVSLLIFAGIVAMLPSNIFQSIVNWSPAQFPSYLMFFVMALLIITAVVIINEGRRNVPVSYAKRVRGGRLYGGTSTYLPININPAGVMPIIFALSILVLPSMIANFLGGGEGVIAKISQNVAVFFSNPTVYGIFYFLLVFVFTYFYTIVTFDPDTVSENLKKMGGFIPGIRPGKSTAHYLNYLLNRILPFGALFLGVIAILPSIVGGLTGIATFRFLIGGTSVLIVVSVILDTFKQINAQLKMREYETL